MGYMDEEDLLNSSYRNRDKSRMVKAGRTWCLTCDMKLVSDGQKCPNCGVRNTPYRNNKSGEPK